MENTLKVDVWDWVLTKDGKILQITSDDMPELPYERIERKATKAEIATVRPMKPLKAKPIFYSHCYSGLQEIAVTHGYNLLIHGSMSRDMDLVAVPWVDKPKSHYELLEAFCEFLGVPFLTDTNNTPCHFSLLPGGRSSYVIDLNRGGKFNGYSDEQYYLDISITPLPVA